MRPAFVGSIVFTGTVVLMAIFAEWLMPHDPDEADLRSRLTPPVWQEGGKTAYLLGTDALGRDMLSRMVLGSRASVVVALGVILIGGGAGTVLGVLAGYCGKLTDAVIMRMADGMLSFPTILLALLLAVVLGPSFANVILVLGLMLWARFSRVIRAEVLAWKARDFVALAKVAGASPFRIMLRHIVPNVTNTVVVMCTLQAGSVILAEASLSFLGVGVPPPTPAWGSMVAAGRNYVATAWWVSALPGIAILMTVIAVNLLGDWLRDALDPRLRQT